MFDEKDDFLKFMMIQDAIDAAKADEEEEEEEKPEIWDVCYMTNEQIWQLGRANIELIDFDLMDNDERIEALELAGLDPEDFT